jgi:acylphosphatase
VRGVVQGVGFRFSTVRTASRLDLTGWVANTPDRSVRVVAEGNRAAVESLIAWLRTGPPAAHVASVDTSWGPATGEFRGFGVR